MRRKPTKENMNNQFDELTKSMAQSVTRRAALKKFGVGVAGMVLAYFGLASKVGAATYQGYCRVGYFCCPPGASLTGLCTDIGRCFSAHSPDCAVGKVAKGKITDGP